MAGTHKKDEYQLHLDASRGTVLYVRTFERAPRQVVHAEHEADGEGEDRHVEPERHLGDVAVVGL